MVCGRTRGAGDHLGDDAFAIEALFQLFGLFEDLGWRLRVDVRHGVVVVEHHGVEARVA